MPSGTEVGNLFAFFGLDVSQLERDTNKAEKQLNSLDKKLKGIGKTAERAGKGMAKAITLPVLAAGGASLKAAGDFQKEMTESLAIMGDVSDSTRTQMEKLAVQMSTETTFAAREAAQAYFYLASAGMDTEHSMKALPLVMKFAQAGAFDLATATDLVTDAQTAMGLNSEDAAENLRNLTRVTDVLVKANTLANAKTEQFSASLTNKAAASLRVTNKEMEEGVAILGAYANAGVKGEKAGRALAIVLRDLQRAALAEKEAFEEVGIEVFDTEGKMAKVADILKQLEDRFATLSVEQRKATLTQLGFQERSQLFLLTILGMSEEIRRFEEELKKAGGTTEEVAGKQLEAFNNQAKLLWNRIKALGIEIGENLIPHVEKLVKWLGKVVDWFRSLDESTQNWIIGLSVAAAALGPLLIIGGKLLGVVANLTIAVHGLGAALSAVGGAAALGSIAAVLIPVGVALAAIGATWALIDSQIKKTIDRSGEMMQKMEDANKKIQASKKQLAKSEEDVLRAAFEAATPGSLDAKRKELALVKETLKNEAARFQRNQELLKHARMLGYDINRNNERRQRSVEKMRELRKRAEELEGVTARMAEEERKRTAELDRQLKLTKAQEGIENILYKARQQAQGDKFAKDSAAAIRQMEDELDALKELSSELDIKPNTAAGEAIQKAMEEAERLKDHRLQLIEEARKKELEMYTATERQKRLIALREEKKKMLEIARTEEEREQVVTAFEQKKENLLRSMLKSISMEGGEEEERTDVQHRLEAIEKGTVEAFRAEQGLDDSSTDQAIRGTQDNTKDTVRLLQELNDFGITIEDLQEVTM